MSYYRQQLEQWLSTTHVNAHRVIDVGGKQGEVKSRVKSWNVDDYQILDLPKWDLDKPWKVGEDLKADTVFCLEVFEYLINPTQALKNISDLLKPGGVAYVTFQFIYPQHNEVEMDSLRYTIAGVERLAEVSDLTLSMIWPRIDKSGLLTKFYMADGMRAAKNMNHAVTGWIVEFIK